MLHFLHIININSIVKDWPFETNLTDDDGYFKFCNDNHNVFFPLNNTYWIKLCTHWNNMCNTTDSTCGEGSAYSSGNIWDIPVFMFGFVLSGFVICMLCFVDLIVFLLFLILTMTLSVRFPFGIFCQSFNWKVM